MTASVVFDFANCSEPAFHYRYLHYFIQALRAHDSANVSIRPFGSRLLAPLIDHGLRGASRAWNTLYRGKDSSRLGATEYVQLTFTTGRGRHVRAVIDFWDAGDLTHPDALEWCDVYFKTNYWPTLEYPRKVLPLMNANGLLSCRDLSALRAMRGAPRTKDLLYWAKIWEPGPARAYSAQQVRNIVEHQLRLFEALATLACDADLIAIVPRKLAALPHDEVVRRLERAGVRAQPDWGNIDTARLWEGLRSARIVFLRTGTHHSISWRMTELLAMGACIAYDGVPFPNWPTRLVADTHYLDGRCALTSDFVLPSSDQYRCLAHRIANLLADETALSALRRQAADYFDSHCRPEAVGDYLLGCVEDASTSR